MKSNTSRFLEDLLFYGNVTLYKMSYNPENPSNTVIRFDLDREGNFRVVKSLQWFTDPFFTVEGVNRSAKPLKTLAEKELKNRELYEALAYVILSDFTNVLFEVDRSTIQYCSNNTFNNITTILLNMVNFSESDLEEFASYIDKLSLNNKDLIEFLSRSKSNISDEISISDKLNKIDDVILSIKENFNNKRRKIEGYNGL